MLLLFHFLYGHAESEENERLMKKKKKKTSDRTQCLPLGTLGSCESSIAEGSRRQRPTRRDGATAEAGPEKPEVVRG